MPRLLVKRAIAFGIVSAMAVLLAGPASARIGVISVTDGGASVGQGADLQIGQRITTTADGRVHLLFVDGSSVTVGPSSSLVIEHFSYDPGSKTGALTLDVRQGTIRFVGGAISKTADVIVRTPSSTVGIRGGIAAVAVKDGGATTASFLAGNAMRVTGQGVTQTATRSGSEIIVAAGGQPGMATLAARGQLSALQTLNRPAGTRPATATAPSIGDALRRSGLDQHNSGLALQQPGNERSMIGQQSRAPVEAMQMRQHEIVGRQQSMRSTFAAVPAPSMPQLAIATPPAIVPAAAVVRPPAGPPIATTVPPGGGGTLTITGSGLQLAGSGMLAPKTGGTTISGGTLTMMNPGTGTGTLIKNGSSGGTIITGR